MNRHAEGDRIKHINKDNCFYAIAIALSLDIHHSYPCEPRFWLEASTLSGEMRLHLPTDNDIYPYSWLEASALGHTSMSIKTIGACTCLWFSSPYSTAIFTLSLPILATTIVPLLAENEAARTGSADPPNQTATICVL